MNIGTPNNIEVLLHFHCSPTKHERADAPAVRGAIEKFVEMGVLQADTDRGEGHYRTTEKGRAWVAALCAVRCPRVAFVDDNGNVLLTLP